MHWPCFAKLIAWEHVLVRIVKIIYWTFLGFILTTFVLTSTMLWYEQWLSSYSYTSTGRTWIRVGDFYRTGILDWWVDLASRAFLYFLYQLISVLVSLDNLLTPLICISSGFLQQKFGPLRLLMFSCIPYTVGWFAAAMARDAYHLYISR